MFSLVWMLVASSAQAHHVHGDWFGQTKVQVASQTTLHALPEDEADCPLCVAMHSALLSATGFIGQLLFTVDGRVGLLLDRIAWRLLQFSLFSRPPPVSFLS